MGKLDELVTLYGEQHTKELALNKECKAMGNEIKDILTVEKLDSYEAGGYIVTRSVTETKVMDEDALLDVIRNDSDIATQCIKTREYVDMEVLESLLYKGEVSKDTILAMDKCSSVKQTVKLLLKKVKRGNKVCMK